MTNDDIIRIAQERGWSHTDDPVTFAAFVDGFMNGAAAEREKIKWNSIHSCHADCQNPACVIVREAVAVEREECAKVCDAIYDEYEGEDVSALWCADAIRKRGES